MVAGVSMKLALRLAPILRRIAFPLLLVNPDAETGDATGWTNEQGVLTVRTQNPPPNQGFYYFADATSAIHKSRQRVDVSAFADDIDAGDFPNAISDEIFSKIVAVIRIAVP